MKLTVAALMILFVLSGCEGYKRGVITVVSKQNGQPLSDVIITPVKQFRFDPLKSDSVTDASGNFKFITTMIPMTFGVPKLKVKVSKPGYETLVFVNEHATDTIRLTKLN
ncbi:hypothetical protein ACFGVR_19525 [Mucilaginibacter sp. AW1-3]